MEKWIATVLKSQVIAPDFRIQKKFFFVLPSCAFPSGNVSEHNNSTCLHGEVDIVTGNTPEAFSLVKLIMPCECMTYGETPVVFTC